MDAELAGYPRLATVTKPYIQNCFKNWISNSSGLNIISKKAPDFEQTMHDVLVVY